MARDAANQKKRTFWTDEEDARLVELVEVHGIHNWPDVASALQGRDSKSCSLRWRYFLAPHIIRSTDQKLSDWEVAVLVWAQREFGNKWRTIVDGYLPWRSPNDLKNYCNQYVSGKHTHVITQNKLVLQNVPLQALLAHPPPEVQERWQRIKLMRECPHKGHERPVKKGTRGLSYIIRQAGKLKAQRGQPYQLPKSAEASLGSALAAGTAAAATAAAASPASELSSRMGGLSGPSLKGEAGAAASFDAHSPAAAGFSLMQPLPGAMFSTIPGIAGLPLLPPGSLSSSTMSSSSGMPLQAGVGWAASINMPASTGMCVGMSMAPLAPQQVPAAAAAAAASAAAPAWALPCPLDCSPAGLSSAVQDSPAAAAAAAATPTSDVSCLTPCNLGPSRNGMGTGMNMNMAAVGAMNMNISMRALPRAVSSAAAGSSAAAAAIAAAAAAAGVGQAARLQGAPRLTASASCSHLELAGPAAAAAAGAAAAASGMWQQFSEPVDFASGNSISSSISSSAFVLEPASYAATTYTGALQLTQQLLPPSFEQQQQHLLLFQQQQHLSQQQRRQEQQPQQHWLQQPQQQHWRQQQQPEGCQVEFAQSTGTAAVCAGAASLSHPAAAAAAAAACLPGAATAKMELPVLLDDEFDAAEFAALLDSDTEGDEQQQHHHHGSCSTSSMAAHAAAAAAAGVGGGAGPSGLLQTPCGLVGAACAAAAAPAATPGRLKLQTSDDFSLDFTSSEGCGDLDFGFELDGPDVSLGGAAGEGCFAFEHHAPHAACDDFDIMLLSAASM